MDNGIYEILEEQRPVYRCGTPERLSLGQSRWGIRHLLWATIDGPADADLRAEMAAGAAATAAICGLTFEESTPQRANLLMTVGRGEKHQLDGRGGILAWFQLPSMNQTSGTLIGRLDLADFNTKPFTFPLLPTVKHEAFGHGLGLPHLRSGALMQNTADPRILSWTSIDIAAHQFLYGPPKSERPVNPVKPDPHQIEDLLAAQRRAMIDAVTSVLGNAAREIEARILNT